MIGLAICVGLLIIFHRPILLTICRHVALRYASKENLKMDFRLEGNPFSYLAIRNLHAMPTGPSAIESVDVDSLYVDYSLLGFARHGVSHLLQNIEVRGARMVLDPARAPPPKPRPKHKTTLPDAFPKRIRLPNAMLNVSAEKIATESLNKFLLLPETYFSGEIERLTLAGTGVIDSPRTWRGTMSLQVNDAHVPAMNFERGAVEISAEQGRATLQSADIVQNQNEFHLNGTIDLPATFENFGRTPSSLQIAGKARDLEKLTAGVPVGLTGSVQFNGKIDIVDANVHATLDVTGESVGLSDGIVDNVNATLRASKKVGRADTNRPWFADLRTAMEFTLTGIRYRDYIVDSVKGSMNGTDDILGLDLVTLRRNQNELSIRGRYQLPENLANAASQPVQLDIALNGSETGDFWVANSPNTISGPLQMTGHIERIQGIVDGQLSLSGSKLKMRDLVAQRLSVQSSIANNVIHLDECSAILNNTDYVNATGTFNLQPPQHYSAKASASVSNLAVLQPLLRAFGNQNQLAGSFKLDWEGSGNAQAFKNAGNLKFVLGKARYGNLQGLQANIDASYSPDGLDVPVIFFATTNMDFN